MNYRWGGGRCTTSCSTGSLALACMASCHTEEEMGSKTRKASSMWSKEAYNTVPAAPCLGPGLYTCSWVCGHCLRPQQMPVLFSAKKWVRWGGWRPSLPSSGWRWGWLWVRKSKLHLATLVLAVLSITCRSQGSGHGRLCPTKAYFQEKKCM